MPSRRASKVSPWAATCAAEPTARTTRPIVITDVRTVLLAKRGCLAGTKIANDRESRHRRARAPARTGAGRRLPETDGDRRPPPFRARQADGPAPAPDQP